MHKNYKLDERVLKELIKNNTQCVDENSNINIIIYYKNWKTCNLVLKNNPAPKPDPIQQHNVIYEFKCPLEHTTDEGLPVTIPQTYIGYTQCSLAKRLENHFYSGSIKEHCISSHQHRPSKQFLKNNTSIICKAEDKQRLLIKESIMILERAPTINRQFDNFKHSLKLNSNRSSSHFINVDESICNTATVNPTPTRDQPASVTQPTSSNTVIDETQINLNNNDINNSLTYNNFFSPNISNRINRLISNSRNSANQTLPALTPVRMMVE